MRDDQKEVKAIAEKWSELRLLGKDELPDDLEPEWKEAHERYMEKYENDMERMTEISEKLVKLIEPPKVEKKTKGQKKRDAYAKVQAREAARAAAK